MKKILLAVGLILIFSGCALTTTQNQDQTTSPQKGNIFLADVEGQPTKLAEQPVDDGLPKITLQKCNIIAKGINLKAAKNYSMLGDDEFDTAVCGYLVKKTENVPFIDDGSKQVNAYLNVVEFADSKFKDSVLKTISEEGNTINQASGQIVELNLGCLQKGEITGISYQSDPYIDAKTMASILASSVEKPVPLVLSFGIHDGRGCNCCNLMHKVRLIE